ncbi:phosphotransferase [Micromonospora echinospora]|uniref:phosphotransferase n=1 Tax=Micromonospora echinospora TaxID=1877 RepID=UPI003435BED3
MTPADQAETATAGNAVIDHGWIRGNLGWVLNGDEPITIQSISLTGGVMGSVDRIRCGDRSFILKGPPDTATAWGSLAATAQSIEREAELYRYLDQRGLGAPKVAPDCYWSVIDAAGGGTVALEDLGTPGHPAAVMAAGLDHAQALAAVRCLARLHAGSMRTGPGRLEVPYPWLYTAESPDLVAAVQLGLADLPGTVTRCWPGMDVRPDLYLDVAGLLRDSHRGSRLAALCHGDAWTANVIFQQHAEAPDGVTAHLIDWQYAMWGNPLSDVALLLWSSLDPWCRRAWQDELLRRYHSELVILTGLDYPLQACLDDLQRAQPAAALVALASVEAYVAGMGPAEHARFRPRVLDALDCASAMTGRAAR